MSDPQAPMGHTNEHFKGTAEIQTHSFIHEGRRVHLVDTPGFNVSSPQHPAVIGNVLTMPRIPIKARRKFLTSLRTGLNPHMTEASD